MKPYGLPRYPGFENGYMDKEECLKRGAKSCCMKMQSKTRQSARRYHKKSYRQHLKVELEI